MAVIKINRSQGKIGEIQFRTGMFKAAGGAYSNYQNTGSLLG